MDALACPCGLGDDYESCCGRLHAGMPAPTAESLMRSRYSAFAVGNAGYLLRTAAGTVRFRAIYTQQGQRGVLTENSSFTRHDGHWTYLGPAD